MLDRWQFFLNYFFIRILTFNYFVIRAIIKEYLTLHQYESILDFGCGIGILAPLFPSKKYLGFDIDEKAIAFARKKYPRYAFIWGNATSLKLDKKFDLIVVVGVLHHLNNMEARQALSVMDSLLTKNGSIIIIEAIPPIYKWNILGQILRSLDNGHFVRTLPEYKKLISSGLEIKEQYAKIGGILDYGVFIISR